MQNTNKHKPFYIYTTSFLAGLIGLSDSRDFFILPSLIISLLMVHMISEIALFYNKEVSTKATLSIFKITFAQLIPVFTGDILLRFFLPDLTGIWAMASCTVFILVVGKESEKYYRNLRL